jgi:hypothetical protein
MKHAKLLLAAALVLALLPAASWAGGTPKQLLGTIKYANGTVPAVNGEVTFTAFITARPGETLTEISTGCGSEYYDPDYWCWVEVGNFPTPWSVGETCQIDFVGDGTTGGSQESNSLQVVLDGTGSQSWGEFYLPVELTSFTGEGGAGLAVLRWSTATETDNLGFWVWRSTEADGEYAKVNEELIKGAGTTAEPQHYSFTDDGLEGGNYFYKLEDVGASGVTQLHGPVEVEVMSPIPTTYGLSINTPNPVTDRTEIRFQLPEAARVKLAVYNVAGSLVNTLVDTNLQAGYYRQEWSAQSVASGIYFYRLEANDFSSTHRMVVLK